MVTALYEAFGPPFKNLANGQASDHADRRRWDDRPTSRRGPTAGGRVKKGALKLVYESREWEVQLPIGQLWVLI